tara:strand:+ start:23134 stop:23505 length:372 start_codon:yes stop_codon:yes gene_type:complete
VSSYTTNRRTDKAVLWAWDGTSVDDDGEPRLEAAAEITVRWEQRTEELVRPDGSTVAIDSNVVVAQDVTEGSIMWLGALADVDVPPTDLRQVVAFNKTKNFDGSQTRRTLKLMKYGDLLPDLA